MNSGRQKLSTQLKKKQSIGEYATVKKDNKDNNYEDLSKTQLIKHIKNKDRFISQLQDGINIKGSSQSEKVNMYRLKLEDEIAQNQKAIKAFGNITEIIIQIISKFKGLESINKEQLANVASIIQIKSETNEKFYNQQQQIEDSQFSCFDEIVDETLNMLQQLGKLTQQNIASSNRYKSQFLKVKAQLEKKQKQVVIIPTPVKRQVEQEINILKQQINQLVLQNKNLKKVLLQNQQQKNNLLKSISTSLTQEQIQLLVGQKKEQLVERIRRMTYRVRQLEKDKKQIFFKAKTEKQVDQKKFQDLLKEVKQIRVNKKLSLSAL